MFTANLMNLFSKENSSLDNVPSTNDWPASWVLLHEYRHGTINHGLAKNE